MPRLELSAAVLAVQLDLTVREESWIFRSENLRFGQTPPVCCSTSEISQSVSIHLLQTGCQLSTIFQHPNSGDMSVLHTTQQMKVPEVLQWTK